MPSELILHRQLHGDRAECRLYTGLPAVTPAFVGICHTDDRQSEQTADDLYVALQQALAGLPGIAADTVPCGGHAGNLLQCYALGIADTRKLLVVVSSGATDTFSDHQISTWTFDSLPVLPEGQGFNLNSPFKESNAARWKGSLRDEIVPLILGKIGLVPEEQKIFISYKRDDTAVVAEQLFERLTKEHFDVFLDRFSIEPGVLFQKRLYQELADKAMVLFLESEHFLASKWIELEVAFAKKYRLGVFAVHFETTSQNPPGAKDYRIPSVDDDHRHPVMASQLDGNGRLVPDTLDSIVREVKRRHAEALVWKRYYMAKNLYVSLRKARANPLYDRGFVFVTSKKGVKSRVLPIVRPPMLPDYHAIDMGRGAEKQFILGPEFQEEQRLAINNWLGRKADVGFFHEGELQTLVNELL